MKLFDWLSDDDADPPSSPLLLEKINALADVPARDLMLPRALIAALDADVQLRRVRRLKSRPTPHLLVYRGDLNVVLGWISKTRTLELLGDPADDVELARHVRPVGYVDEATSIARLPDLFLKAESPLLVVRNAALETTGLITLADLIARLFGFTLPDLPETLRSAPASTPSPSPITKPGPTRDL